jgi:hypothetical protein
MKLSKALAAITDEDNDEKCPMNRVFIGPWILNWWQGWSASLFCFLYYQMSVTVQKIQVWLTSTSNQFLKARA